MCMESLLPEHLKNEFVELLEKKNKCVRKIKRQGLKNFKSLPFFVRY